jgi:hypothetical protein
MESSWPLSFLLHSSPLLPVGHPSVTWLRGKTDHGDKRPPWTRNHAAHFRGLFPRRGGAHDCRRSIRDRLPIVWSSRQDLDRRENAILAVKHYLDVTQVTVGSSGRLANDAVEEVANRFHYGVRVDVGDS